MFERALLGNWKYAAAILDFSGAFDTVLRPFALDRMEEAGCELTGAIRTLVSGTTARVRMNWQVGEPFNTNIGVAQGDPMSPISHEEA